MLLNRSAEAATGINKQISFQGKVVAKADGTNVTNGSYSFTFRIYSSSSGDTGSPCLSTCIWEETKTLTVTSGIFQTNLGDTTALPGSVDFNSDTLYLSVKFNGDTEMSPRIRLAAVPYAFNADKLGGLSSSSYAQLSPGSQQTGSLNISGDLNVGSGSSLKINGTTVCSSTTCTAASGSSFYIQNSTGSQTANFNIQSAAAGSIGGIIKGATSQTADLLELQNSSSNILTNFDSKGYLHIAKAAATTDNAVSLRVSGDTNDRFVIAGDGTLYWGSGSASSDVNLYRSGTNAIRTDNNFIAGTHLWTGAGSGNLTSTLGVTSSVSTQVAEIIQGVTSQTADLLQLQDSGSNILLRVSSSGVVGTADTSTAATNTTATTLRTGNSTTSGNTGALSIATGNATNGNSGNITIGAGTATGTAGGVIVKNGTNSNTAFQIQTASSFAILTADATNTRIDLKGGLSTAPLGSTLLTNGDFATNSCSSWTCGSGWAATTGAAVHTAGNVAALSQTISVTNNTTYQIDFTTSGATAGGLTLAIGANTDGWQYWDSNTHRTVVAPSTGSLTFSITPTTDFNGTLDNITVKAITGSTLAVERQLNSDGTVGLESRSGGSGLQNTYLGVNAGQYSTTGNGNAAVGNNAFQGNTSGSWNAVLGQNGLFSNTTGSWNVAVGQQALYSNTVGTSNVAIGQDALHFNVNGNTNTAIGASAGYNNVSGYGNVFIGATAGFNETGNNKLYIANSTTSTPLIGGDFSGAQSLTVNGSATFKPTSGNDSTTAFQIQDASSNDILNVDTTNKIVTAGTVVGTTLLTDNFESGSIASWTSTLGSGSTAAIDSGTVHGGSYSAKIVQTGNKAILDKSFTASSNVVASGYVYVASQTTTTAVNIFGLFPGAPASSPNFTVTRRGSDSAICVWNGTWIANHCSATATLPLGSWHFIQLKYIAGTGTSAQIYLYLDGAYIPDASWPNTATGGNTVDDLEMGHPNNGVTDTVYYDDMNVNVLATSPSLNTMNGLQVNNTTVIDTNYNMFATSLDSVNATSLTIGATNATSIALSAATTVKTTSTAALQVQNASSTPFFTVNSSTNSIQIGNTSADGTAVLLQLDQYNGGTTDPTGVAGAMYYNSTLGKLRCYQGTIWTNCLGTPFFPDRHWGVFSATGAANTTVSAAGTIDAGASLTGDTTATNDQAEDMYIKHSSGTTSGTSQAGYISATGTEERWRPYLQTRIKLDSTITSERLFVAISSAGAGANMSDSPTAPVWGGIRYSTSASDTTFKCGAGNASASAFTDTGVTVTASHYYTMIVDWTTSGQITCRISDNGGAYSSTTVTTDVVTSNSAVMYNHAELTTLTTAARILNVAYMYVERN
jgi:hypothetical protein